MTLNPIPGINLNNLIVEGLSMAAPVSEFVSVDPKAPRFGDG